MAVRIVRSFLSSTHSSRITLLTRGIFHTSKVHSRTPIMSETPVADAVKSKLTAALKPEHLDVINESYMHNVPKGTESHFKVVIVSAAFEGISRIKKHQLVHQAIKEEVENDIHALSIVAKTPKEWAENPDIGKSPPCRGGAGL